MFTNQMQIIREISFALTYHADATPPGYEDARFVTRRAAALLLDAYGFLEQAETQTARAEKRKAEVKEKETVELHSRVERPAAKKKGKR